MQGKVSSDPKEHGCPDSGQLCRDQGELRASYMFDPLSRGEAFPGLGISVANTKFKKGAANGCYNYRGNRVI